MTTLVLSRYKGESILIGDSIRVTVADIMYNHDLCLWSHVDGGKLSIHVLAQGDTIHLADSVTVLAKKIGETRAILAITAPSDVIVDREEVRERRVKEQWGKV